jgi:hypothetical protein
MLGLSMVPAFATCNHFVVSFPLKVEVFEQCLYKFVIVRFVVLYPNPVCNNYLCLCCKNVMVIVSLDSPSCEVCLIDPESGGFIGTLPDRPLGCSV